MEIRISMDLLRRMLRDSYESGWYGAIELAEDKAEEIIRLHEAHFVKLKALDGPGYIDGSPSYGESQPRYGEYRPQPPLTISDHPVVGRDFQSQPRQMTFDFGDQPSVPPQGIQITPQQGYVVMQDTEFTLPAAEPFNMNVTIDPEAWRNAGDG